MEAGEVGTGPAWPDGPAWDEAASAHPEPVDGDDGGGDGWDEGGDGWDDDREAVPDRPERPGPGGREDAVRARRAAARRAHADARLGGSHLLVLVAVAGVALVVGLLITQRGVVRGGDSVTYLGVAQNIVDGHGITSPFVNEWDGLGPDDAAASVGAAPLILWPPLYPLAIATVSSQFGVDIESAARLVNVAGLALLAVSTAWVTGQLARGSRGAMLAAGLFMVFSPGTQLFTAAAYSDVLAAGISTLAVGVLLLAVRSDWRWLFAFWFLASAASLTRFAAVGLIVAGGYVVLRRLPVLLRGRIVLSAFVASSVLPLLVWRRWASRDITSAASAVSSHPRWDAVTELPRVAYELLVPPQVEGTLRPLLVGSFLLLAVLAVVHLALRWSGRLGPRRPLLAPDGRRTLLPVIVGYTAVVLVTAFFTGARLSVDGRMFLSVFPLVVALIVAAVTGLTRGADDAPRVEAALDGVVPRLVLGVVVVIGAWVGWHGLPTNPLPGVWEYDIAARDVTMARLVDGSPLTFSNSPQTLYALTEEPSAAVPTRLLPATNEPNPAVDAELAEIHRLLREQHGRVVLFPGPDYLGDGLFVPSQDLVDRLGLRKVGRTRSGVVYEPV